jgi:hypothetical protein
MMATLMLPLLAPDSSDAPQILVTHMALGLCVCAPPDLRAFARRDGGLCAMPVERVVASPLVVGAVGAYLFDLTGRVLKQIRQDLGVADIICARHDTDEIELAFRLCAAMYVETGRLRASTHMAGHLPKPRYRKIASYTPEKRHRDYCVFVRRAKAKTLGEVTVLLSKRRRNEGTKAA